MISIAQFLTYERMLCLLAILLNSGVCLGVTLKMSGSSPYAITNNSYTLTCTVAQAVNFNDKVIFSRKEDGSTFASLTQNLAVCSTFTGAPAGYSEACGTGTNDANADTKTYTVVIDKVAEIDLKIWSCFLNSDKNVQSSFTLQLFILVICVWSIGLCVVISILIVVGGSILFAVFKFSDKSLKNKLFIVLLADGVILFILAMADAILLGVETNLDIGTGKCLAATVFSALGFVFGIAYVGLGVWQIVKNGKADSGSVSNKPTELHSTNTPGQPTELDSTNAHRQPLNANNETTNKPPN